MKSTDLRMSSEKKHKPEQSKEAEKSKQLTFEQVPQEQQSTDIGSEDLTQTTEQEENSIKAETHTRSSKKTKTKRVVPIQKRWQKILGLSVGLLAFVALAISAVASQYYKNKVMPGVVVANVASGAKSEQALTRQLEEQQKDFKVTFASGEKRFEPTFTEIGLQLNTKKTVENALRAKRHDGLTSRIQFWNRSEVPVVYTVNDSLLNQYLESNLPELKKAPQDSQLQFDSKTQAFVITPQADGEGVNLQDLKKQLDSSVKTLSNSSVKVSVAKKGPAITEAEIKPMLEPANALTQRKVVLTGLGYTFQAKPADIALWLTPTPQKDGSLKLVVDPAKVQSYVDSVSKRISNAPVDRKVIKDQQSGAEVVLQEGRSGTELAEKQILANAITDSLKSGKDVTQTMNITTAAFQTVNMEAYEKWIEVDLSEQRTTAYERATPVKNFIIASGTKGHETVTGEFEIWLKVRKQTMQGGSKADGSYYSIPNVEWVSYFYKDYALHGAWWREKFGFPASHGCVNMSNTDAQWVFEWAPVGTKVIVHQ